MVADLVVGGEVGVAEPVVADHALFVGVGDGPGLESFAVGVGTGNFGGEVIAQGLGEIHEGEVEGEAEVGVADEVLGVGGERHFVQKSEVRIQGSEVGMKRRAGVVGRTEDPRSQGGGF